MFWSRCVVLLCNKIGILRVEDVVPFVGNNTF